MILEQVDPVPYARPGAVGNLRFDLRFDFDNSRGESCQVGASNARLQEIFLRRVDASELVEVQEAFLYNDPGSTIRITISCTGVASGWIDNIFLDVGAGDYETEEEATTEVDDGRTQLVQNSAFRSNVLDPWTLSTVQSASHQVQNEAL